MKRVQFNKHLLLSSVRREWIPPLCRLLSHTECPCVADFSCETVTELTESATLHQHIYSKHHMSNQQLADG